MTTTPDKAAMPELKSCPLCHENEAYYTEGEGNHYGEILCSMCGLTLTDNIDDQKPGASIRRWNTRADLAPRQAVDAYGKVKRTLDYLADSSSDFERKMGNEAIASLGLIAPPARDGSSEPMALAECPVGLFLCDKTLCLKTEYGNNEGRIDAYIVESGEFFWGDAPQTIASQRAQIVTPVEWPLYAHPDPSPAPGDTDRAEALSDLNKLDNMHGRQIPHDHAAGEFHVTHSETIRRALSQPAAPVVPDKSPDLANNETCAPNSTNDALMAMVRELVDAHLTWKQNKMSNDLFITHTANIATRMALELDTDKPKA